MQFRRLTGFLRRANEAHGGAHAHSHAHGAVDTGDGWKTPRGIRIALAAVIIPTLIGALIAGAILRPTGPEKHNPALGVPTDLVKGRVTSAVPKLCQEGYPEAGECTGLQVAMRTGPDAGKTIVMTITNGPGQPKVVENDAVVLGRSVNQGQVTYYFSDLERSNGIALLGIAFALFTIAIGRVRGFGALIGLGVTFVAITKFMLPSILDGNSPVLVTLVGATLIVIAVLYVAHGISARTTTAIIGTLISLGLVGIGAAVAVKVALITGLSNEEVSYIQGFAQNVNIKGLLLAGIMLGGLGVLNDMTVSQASSVWEIHAARPDASRASIYAAGMRVGRDHIASTIYTLVLAYTGASLPLLILFTLSDRTLGSVLTTDLVGEEIVRAVVGALGIVASVPITTALATLIVKTTRPDTSVDNLDLPHGNHGDTNLDTGVDSHNVAEVLAPARADVSTAPAETTEASKPKSGRRFGAHRKEERPTKDKKNKSAGQPNFERPPMSRREKKFWESE